jgi:hypothetical protein
MLDHEEGAAGQVYGNHEVMKLKKLTKVKRFEKVERVKKVKRLKTHW